MEGLPAFTHDQLAQYTGTNAATDNKVYIAIKGVVFDVSAADFYKPGGAYNAFAGHDASVALAKMSKDEAMLDPSKYNWKECLDENEKIMLDNWFNRLSEKYQKVGVIA